MTAEAFYAGLLDAFTRELKLPIGVARWWQEHTLLSAVQRFANFVSDEVLPRVQKRLVVFIDEIDLTLKLDFSDSFFTVLRAFYNERARNPAFERLSFVLAGVAPPQDLIKDRLRSPFNIGSRIELAGFTPEEARKLAEGLPMEQTTAVRLIDRILYWTGGQPYLTQKVAADLTKVTQCDGEQRCVDALIDALFFSEETWKDLNLPEVRTRIVQDPDDPGALLALYRRILMGEEVLDDERSLTHARLKLSGIVKVSPRGVLEPANRIYARVFDRVWVETTQRALLERQAVSQAGSGAVALQGGVAAGKGGVAVGGNVYGNIYTGLPVYSPNEALVVYRRVLVESFRHLSLRGLDLAASDATGAQQRFELAQLYVELLTTTQVPRQKRGGQRNLQRELLREERETSPLSALEAVISYPQVVLLESVREV
jgi:hypothetical protein